MKRQKRERKRVKTYWRRSRIEISYLDIFPKGEVSCDKRRLQGDLRANGGDGKSHGNTKKTRGKSRKLIEFGHER